MLILECLKWFSMPLSNVSVCLWIDMNFYTVGRYDIIYFRNFGVPTFPWCLVIPWHRINCCSTYKARWPFNHSCIAASYIVRATFPLTTNCCHLVSAGSESPQLYSLKNTLNMVRSCQLQRHTIKFLEHAEPASLSKKHHHKIQKIFISINALIHSVLFGSTGVPGPPAC
jgi:hypothetical protein